MAFVQRGNVVRIALVPLGESPNGVYRSIGPLMELQRRGHEARRLDPRDARGASALVRWCDVLHIHRHCDEGIVELARAAKASGAAVVWDDDDDSLRPPKEFRQLVHGREAAMRLAARARLFELADLVTTTGPGLAEIFRSDGAREVQTIENYVIDELAGDPRPRAGFEIGWPALREHELDLVHIPLVDALRRLLDAHPHVRVTTIGIELRALAGDRYSHLESRSIQELMARIASFDVGIAPLSPEVRMNHGRSNVKVKEYAVVGVPWLASPIGPYAGLGEREGGRPVPDDRWFEELDALVRNTRQRRRLAKRATRWGRSQLLSRNVERWERAFVEAIERARVPVAA